MNYATIKECDVANGPGVRVSLFVSGCNHHCKGCFNEIAWNFNYGNEFNEETINKILKDLDRDYIEGLSLLGGEPLEYANQKGLVELVKKVKEKFPETALIFITPPSADELKKRLVGRGTETAEQIEKRMSRAVDECPYMNQYDYIVVNDDLDECVDEIHRLLQSIHNAKENQQELINMITEDLKKYK